jgi:shikimate dehydrogenase
VTHTIDGSTRIYAVFGDPVAQVQTPRLANPLFEAAGANIVALPFHVSPNNLSAAWEVFRSLPNIAGIGVTVPHKIAAAGLCDTLTPAARAVGVANAIQRGADGRMHGALFDGDGFVRGVGAARLAGRRVLLVGAGGAGRAIAFALACAGVAKLTVFDCDADAAEATVTMVTQLTPGVVHSGGPEIADHDMVINATPMGLKAGDAFPIDLAELSTKVLVADIAALDRETELLRHARSIGCATSDGNDMLTAQISLIAGFAAGQPAGEPLVSRQSAAP